MGRPVSSPIAIASFSLELGIRRVGTGPGSGRFGMCRAFPNPCGPRCAMIAESEATGEIRLIINQVKGITKSTRTILAEHGIFSVEELANADVEQLVKLAGFNKAKAMRMIRAAKYLVGDMGNATGTRRLLEKRADAAPEGGSSVGSVDLSDGQLYINRELSFLEFNRRVLEQAKDDRTPLLERLNFLSISCSNLDEFFEVRAAGLIQLADIGATQTDPDSLAPQETLAAISARAHKLVAEQYRVLNQILLPLLAEQGIRFVRRSEWNSSQQTWLKAYFEKELLPILSPIGLDPAHPFPRILNKSLNFIVPLSGKDAFGRHQTGHTYARLYRASFSASRRNRAVRMISCFSRPSFMPSSMIRSTA